MVPWVARGDAPPSRADVADFSEESLLAFLCHTSYNKYEKTGACEDGFDEVTRTDSSQLS